jgi:hypothetical protein
MRFRSSFALAVVAVGFASACGSSSSGGSAAPTSCGDGAVQSPEVCDDGAANGTRGHCKKDCTGMPAKVSITGDVFSFMSETSGARVSGATISVREQPARTTTTDADAHFELADLEEGSEVTLVMDHPLYVPLQTATITLGAHGVHPFTLQAATKNLFKLLSSQFPGIDLDLGCVMATTVARLGGTLHVNVRQGEADVLVTSTPALPTVNGPVYFGQDVIPDMKLTATTIDGGVVYYNVPAGDYVLGGTKPGVAFTPVKMKCRPGYLVNAGPPLGIQANVTSPDWGGTVPDDATTASLDALCTRTAECENQASPGHYPPATVDSCKAMFRRALSFVDPTCDATANVKSTWKAFADCKSKDCPSATGGDTVCATEEAAWNTAMAAYAPCYATAHK